MAYIPGLILERAEAPGLPLGSNTGLELARERVLLEDQSGEDRAEVRVEQIEGFGAELDVEAFGDLRVLDDGRLEPQSEMLADLA